MKLYLSPDVSDNSNQPQSGHEDQMSASMKVLGTVTSTE